MFCKRFRRKLSDFLGNAVYRTLYLLLSQKHICLVVTASSKRYENIYILRERLKQLREDECSGVQEASANRENIDNFGELSSAIVNTVSIDDEVFVAGKEVTGSRDKENDRLLPTPKVRVFQIGDRTGVFVKYCCLAASKIVVLDQSNKILSRLKLGDNTVCIQSWHGGGLYKKVGFDALRQGYDEGAEEKRVKRIHRNISYFITSDKKLTKQYSSIFHLPEEKILPLGIPRTDRIYKRDSNDDRRIFYKKYPEAEGKRIVVFSPTFRTTSSNVNYFTSVTNTANESGGNVAGACSNADVIEKDSYKETETSVREARTIDIGEATKEAERCCHTVLGGTVIKGSRRCHDYQLDFDSMSKDLGDEYFLVLRKHPSVDDDYEPAGWVWDKDTPNNLIISVADILITDYSSILFDFSVTRKPVLLFVPDIGTYTKYERGLYNEPEDLVGSKNVFTDTVSLINAIKKNNIMDSSDLFTRYMSACDGNATNRLIKFMQAIILEKF